MPDLKIAVIMPVAHEDRCRENLPLWAERGYDLILLQDVYRFDVSYLGAWLSKGASLHLVIDPSGPYKGWPSCVNTLVVKAQEVFGPYDVLVAAGDDMRPTPGLTAQQVARRYLDRFPDGFGIMQPTGDSWVDSLGKVSERICGSPIFGRGWVTRAYGGRGVLCPEYKNFYADEELLNVAKKLGVLWQDDGTSHEHDHWSRKPDARPPVTHALTNSWWDRDKATFERRRDSGWPGYEPLPPRV